MQGDGCLYNDGQLRARVFGKMREGRFVMFVIRGESPSNLRIAEVLKKEGDFVKVQYYADRAVKNYGNAELTPGLRRVVPEWHDKSTGQVNLRPTSRDLNRGNLVKRTERFARGEIELVIATFALHSDGKMPDVQVEKAEKWLRMRSKSDERALRALPGKSARSSRTSRPRESDRSARSRPGASEEESLALCTRIWAKRRFLGSALGEFCCGRPPWCKLANHFNRRPSPAVFVRVFCALGGD